MAPSTPAQRMEHVIRTYIQACNDADAEAIAACFCADAVHYFPAPFGKCAGAAPIGSHFATRVREYGMCWTVDQLITDADRCAATLEWTEFIRHPAPIVRRGVDWSVFEPQTWCMQEVRSYTALPLVPVHADMARQELQDFDYAGRGYPTTFPAEHTQ